MLFDTTETIIAVSTAPGYSRRGIVRISGERTLSVLADCWLDYSAKPLFETEFSELPSWQSLAGRFVLCDGVSVPVSLVLFRGPASYTAEDMAEIHLPGSARLLDMVLARLAQYPDVRLAQAGEFTARAFLNGRIDLTQAEAVAEVIHAGGDAQLRAAENLLSGALHERCRVYAGLIAGLLAQVEAGIDFTDQEDVSFIDNNHLKAEIVALISSLDSLISTSASWQDLRHLPKAVLVGLPNAGKSSLMNYLTGLDRSIVCAIAGTTRDILSAPLSLPLGECMLYDTPGLAEVSDPLGSESQERALAVIKDADLVLLLWDPSQIDELPGLLARIAGKFHAPLLSVTAKRDIYHEIDVVQLARKNNIPEPTLFISAITGENIDALKEKIGTCLNFDADVSRAEVIALSRRQMTALHNCQISLHHLHSALEQELAQEELIALDLREALDHIGSISGQIVSDDVLGLIFSRFCIGK